MFGYSIKAMNPEELVMTPSKSSLVFFCVFILIGFVFIVVGVFSGLRMIDLDYSYIIPLSFGIIFFSGGLLFLSARKIPDKMIFDKKTGRIALYEGTDESFVPFCEIKKIEISRKISRSYSSGGKSSTTTAYQAALVKKNGNSLVLFESGSRSKVKKIAEIVLEYLDADFYDSGVEVKKGETSYMKDSDYVPVLPANTSIKISENDGVSVYSWTGLKGIITYILVMLIVAGFDLLFFNMAVRGRNINAGIIAGFVILAIINIFFLVIFISAFSSRSEVTVTRDSFTYRSYIFNLKVQDKNLPLADMGGIDTGITASDSGYITVYSREGRAIYDEMKEKSGSSSGSGVTPDIFRLMGFWKNIIQINASVLSYSEKVFLEHKWFENAGVE